MVEVSHYTVTAERSGRWWSLQAVEAPAALSQVSRLDQADQIVEAIAFVTGEREKDISIEVRPVNLPDSWHEHLEAARHLRELAASSNSQSAREYRAAAQDLAAAGLSVRDIGTVLEVSAQRAHQLVTAARD